MADELPITPPAPDPAVQPAPTQPIADAAPEPSPLVKQLAELGFEGVKDEQEGVSRLIAAHKQLKDEFGTQIRTALDELRQQTPPTGQFDHKPAAPTARKPWEPPQVDLDTIRLYRNGDQWKDGTPNEIKSQFAEYEQHATRFGQALLYRPKEAIGDLIREIAREEFQNTYGKATAEQQQQQAFEKLTTENTWLWQPDPITNKPSGHLSAEGQLVDAEMRRLTARGIDPVTALEFAVDKHQTQKLLAAAKQGTPADAAAINAAKKLELVQRAAPGINRDGSLPPASKVRNTNLSPGQKYVQNVRQAGLQV